jgi:hypothetical protein
VTLKVLLLGDSHSNIILPAVRKRAPEIEFLGGQLPLGPGWQMAFHRGGTPLLFTRNEVQRQFEFWAEAAAGRPVATILDVDMPIVLSMSNIEHLVHSWIWTKWCPTLVDDREFISRAESDQAAS